MFNIVLITEYVFALFCFVTLYFIPAGYGKMVNKKWGITINNKIGWLIMECPTIVVMFSFIVATYYLPFTKEEYISRILVLLPFICHYVYRSFIFPFLLRGKSAMPITIVLMGLVFNTINASLISTWCFYISNKTFYSYSYFKSPNFIIGLFVFLIGFIVNIDSDAYIRGLRKAGDTKHYFPHRHLYKLVSSANYLGEMIEWLGFAILTSNPASYLFLVWTGANLIPRSHAIYKQYQKEFPEEMARHKVKRIFPFIY
ncbi:MAG: DUF1295 domain-containing protein [Treponema sp.]